jgi:hemerythrin superfamily protein
MTQDVLAAIKADHNAVEALLARFEGTPITQRGDYFCEVTHMLVGHEIAEEMVVYPAVRRASDAGGKVADERIHEQSEAEQMLSELEKFSPESAEFTSTFKRLSQAVLEHAQAEESTVFPLLEQSIPAAERETMGDRYQKAKSTAPTHPHPHAPDTPPGNMVLGPIAAVFDRARDAVSQA